MQLLLLYNNNIGGKSEKMQSQRKNYSKYHIKQANLGLIKVLYKF